MLDVRRREFITLLGGAAVWPLAASGQQSERVRRIGVLMSQNADYPDAVAMTSAFAQGLQERVSLVRIASSLRADIIFGKDRGRECTERAALILIHQAH
jgi:hypothetical protein